MDQPHIRALLSKMPQQDSDPFQMLQKIQAANSQHRNVKNIECFPAPVVSAKKDRRQEKKIGRRIQQPVCSQLIPQPLQ